MKMKTTILAALLAVFTSARAADTLASQTWVANRLGAAGITNLVNASNKLASQNWVKDVLTNMGLYTPATVTTNANGSITVYGAWSCPDLTNAVGLAITIARPTPVTMRREVPRTFSLWNILIPSTYAEIVEINGEEWIKAKITAGSWTDTNDNVYEFDFGEGYELEKKLYLGTKPSGVHTCYDLGVAPKCYCGGYGLKEEDIETPAEYVDMDGEEFEEQFGDAVSWIDTENWPKDAITVTGKGDNRVTHYWISDSVGHRVDITYILRSDAWKRMIKLVYVEYLEWMYEAAQLYKQSLICKKANPQHDNSQIKRCGAYSWGNCTRCGETISGTEQHEIDPASYRDAGHNCKCRAKTFAHSPVNSSPVYQRDANGVEVSYYINQSCSACSWTKRFVHTHKWTYCSGCKEKTVDGSACTKTTCPWCGGTHNMQGDGCKTCACRDCGITKVLTLQGAAHVATRTDHGGWNDCDDPEDGNDYPGVGKHCVCSCGYNGCAANDTGVWSSKYGIYLGTIVVESTHTRNDRNTADYTFEDLGDGVQHYAFNKDPCEYCGAEFATKENHYSISGDGGVAYKWVDDDHHLKGLKCRDANDRGCGAEYFPSTHTSDDLEGHEMKTGDTLVWEAVTVSGAAKCRSYYHCAKCREKVYAYEDHSPDANNGCMCSRGCGHQCDHAPSSELDACGNQTCSVCDTILGDESHLDAVADGLAHHCPCGNHAGLPHIYINNICSLSQWGTGGCGAEKPGVIEGHAHKYVNCVCRGDPNDATYAGCGAACTDCDGKHDFSDPTATACAKCQCSGCSVSPDDIALHSGWTPCGQSDEESNDWPGAKGAHCACACLKFGHAASTGHNHSGDDRIQALGADDADYATKHLHVTGKCKRCTWRMASKVSHALAKDDRGHALAVYKDTADGSKCYASGKCECGYEMTGDAEDAVDHVVKPGSTNYADNGNGTCTPSFVCANCLHEHDGEPVEHVRGEGCKCKYGCGYQLAHEYTAADACGFERCAHCDVVKDAAHTHHYASGNNAAAGHYCKCGKGKVMPHAMVSKAGGGYRCSVAGCGFETSDTTAGGYGWAGDHTHDWEDCADCTICGVPCPTCPQGGKHSITEATSSACAACACVDCMYTLDGESNHVGWHECSEEDSGEDAHGAHCVCVCGHYSHASGHDHEYGRIEYREKKLLQTGITDPVNHYRTRGKCDRSPCDHEYKVPESHALDAGKYTYANVHTCLYTRVCSGPTGCGWNKVDYYDHIKGDVSQDWHDARALYNGVETNMCVKTWACANCKEPNVIRLVHLHDLDYKTRTCSVVASDPTKCQYYAECKRCRAWMMDGDPHPHVDGAGEDSSKNCICDHVGCGAPAHHLITEDPCLGGCTECEYGHTQKCGPITRASGLCKCGKINRGHVYPSGRCNCAGYIAGNGCTADARKDRDEYVVKGALITQTDVTCNGEDESTHALDSSGEFECKGCGEDYIVYVYDGTRHCRRCNDIDHPVTSFAVLDGYHTCPEVSEDAWTCACACKQYGDQCQYKDDENRRCGCASCVSANGECACCTKDQEPGYYRATFSLQLPDASGSILVNVYNNIDDRDAWSAIDIETIRASGSATYNGSTVTIEIDTYNHIMIYNYKSSTGVVDIVGKTVTVGDEVINISPVITRVYGN